MYYCPVGYGAYTACKRSEPFMEFEFKGNKIIFNRELFGLDTLVLKFVKILDAHEIDYVIISGYIAILFCRSRNTEDVDLFIE